MEDFSKFENNNNTIVFDNKINSVIRSYKQGDNILYSYGIKDPNQDRVLVDNKDDRSFGILNVKTNNYKKLYSYKGNSRSSFSSVIELNSYNNYVQINCSISNCDEPKTYIYDLENDTCGIKQGINRQNNPHMQLGDVNQKKKEGCCPL